MRTIYNRQVLTLISVIMFTAILVLVSALAVSGTVLCQSSQAGKEQWEYEKALEQEYVEAVREYLEGQGYKNSGVTMDRVTEGGRSVEYTVTIHHRKISALESAERTELALECGKLAFPVEGCSLRHTFLETSF